MHADVRRGAGRRREEGARAQRAVCCRCTRSCSSRPNPIPVKWALAADGPDRGRHPPAAGAAVEAVPRAGHGGNPVGGYWVCLTGAGPVTFAPLRRGGRAVEGAGLEFQLHLHRCTWVRIPPSPPTLAPPSTTNFVPESAAHISTSVSFRPSTAFAVSNVRLPVPAFCRMYVTPTLAFQQIGHGHGAGRRALDPHAAGFARRSDIDRRQRSADLDGGTGCDLPFLNAAALPA